MIMRKKELILGMLAMATVSLCACGSEADTTEKNTTTKVVEQQSSSTTADTTNEQVTTEEVTTEQATTEEETTTEPKIIQCQDIKDTTGVDIFSLEGIKGPKPIEFSFGVVDVFWQTVPNVCKWDKEAKAFFAENNGNNENNEYFAMYVDAGYVEDDDSYEKCLAKVQANQLEEKADGNTCRLAYVDTGKRLAYYSMKKEYETIDGADFVKYNIRIAYYQYDTPATVYTDYYTVFDYEITKPLSIENIESIIEDYYSRNVYENNICMAYGLMPK